MEAYKFLESKGGKQVFRGVAILTEKENESDIIKELKNRKIDSVPVRYQGDSMILDFEEALK